MMQNCLELQPQVIVSGDSLIPSLGYLLVNFLVEQTKKEGRLGVWPIY